MTALAVLVFSLFFLLLPAMIIFFTMKSSRLDKIDVVTLSFIVGIVVAMLASFLKQNGVIQHLSISILNPSINSELWSSTQSNILDISIAFALPLIISSFNVKQAIKSSKGVLFAMMLSVISMMTVSFILAIVYQYFFPTKLPEIWQYISLAFGAYVGGGVNMAVIQSAIEIDESVFIMMTGYDIFLSSLYLFIVLGFATPLIRKILPAYNSDITMNNQEKYSNKNNGLSDSTKNIDSKAISSESKNNSEYLQEASYESAEQFLQLLPLSQQKYNIASLAIAGLIVILSLFLASFFPDSISATATIVIITSLSLLSSMVPAVNRLPTSYRLGSYLLMVFCFTIGSMVDISTLTNLNFQLVVFLMIFIWSGFTLHLLLCKFFNVDADSFLVTSVASIMSLPFVPLIVNRLGNRELLIPGLSVAIIGYILGTYLGILLAYVLQWLL